MGSGPLSAALGGPRRRAPLLPAGAGDDPPWRRAGGRRRRPPRGARRAARVDPRRGEVAQGDIRRGARRRRGRRRADAPLERRADDDAPQRGEDEGVKGGKVAGGRERWAGAGAAEGRARLGVDRGASRSDPSRPATGPHRRGACREGAAARLCRHPAPSARAGESPEGREAPRQEDGQARAVDALRAGDPRARRRRRHARADRSVAQAELPRASDHGLRAPQGAHPDLEHGHLHPRPGRQHVGDQDRRPAEPDVGASPAVLRGDRRRLLRRRADVGRDAADLGCVGGPRGEHEGGRVGTRGEHERRRSGSRVTHGVGDRRRADGARGPAGRQRGGGGGELDTRRCCVQHGEQVGQRSCANGAHFRAVERQPQAGSVRLRGRILLRAHALPAGAGGRRSNDRGEEGRDRRREADRDPSPP